MRSLYLISCRSDWAEVSENKEILNDVEYADKIINAPKNMLKTINDDDLNLILNINISNSGPVYKVDIGTTIVYHSEVFLNLVLFHFYTP